MKTARSCFSKTPSPSMLVTRAQVYADCTVTCTGLICLICTGMLTFFKNYSTYIIGSACNNY